MSTALISRKQVLGAPVQARAIAAVMFGIALLFSLPFVAPIHRYPLTTFDSEWMSAGLLAAAMLVAAVARPTRVVASWPLPLVGLILVAVAGLHQVLGLLHYTFALNALLMFVCAFIAAYLLGRWLVAADLRAHALRAICIGLVVGGVASVAVQMLQIFDVRELPTWLVFPNIDKMSSRRPYANLAQPNHLATYFIWATIAALYLMRRGVSRGPLLIAAAAFFVGLALTGSRMGSLFGLLLLGIVLTRNALSPVSSRERVLASVVLVSGYMIGLVLIGYFLVDDAGAMSTAIGRYAEGSFGQRWSMWSDAWRIASAYPWLGAGVGEYGGAQYWFAQPDPSLLATNNPHNIILHLAAEFGLPAAAIIVTVVAWWCWRRAIDARHDPIVMTALVLVMFVLAHSMLEYPLWHLY